MVVCIDAEVERANRDSEWKEKAMGFMTLEMDHRARERYAKEQGIAKAEERNNKLVEALLAADRVDDLRRSVKDVSFRQRLYKEFGIS